MSCYEIKASLADKEGRGVKANLQIKIGNDFGNVSRKNYNTFEVQSNPREAEIFRRIRLSLNRIIR